jgi:hypothetical protein
MAFGALWYGGTVKKLRTLGINAEHISDPRAKFQAALRAIVMSPRSSQCVCTKAQCLMNLPIKVVQQRRAGGHAK